MKVLVKDLTIDPETGIHVMALIDFKSQSEAHKFWSSRGLPDPPGSMIQLKNFIPFSGKPWRIGVYKEINLTGVSLRPVTGDTLVSYQADLEGTAV